MTEENVHNFHCDCMQSQLVIRSNFLRFSHNLMNESLVIADSLLPPRTKVTSLSNKFHFVTKHHKLLNTERRYKISQLKGVKSLFEVLHIPQPVIKVVIVLHPNPLILVGYLLC